MIENLGGVTSELVGMALDAALLRQEVFANNVANASTPGFSAQRVAFEEQLTQQLNALDVANKDEFRREIDAFKSRHVSADTLIVSEGTPVELDREMIRMAENALRYQALIKASSLNGDVMKMAVKEGR